MSRKFIFAIAGAALGLGVAVSAANAAPGTLAPLNGAAAADSLVQKTHGFHRSCVRFRGWWHRHSFRGRSVSCFVRPRPYRDCFFDRRGRRVCVWRRR